MTSGDRVSGGKRNRRGGDDTTVLDNRGRAREQRDDATEEVVFPPARTLARYIRLLIFRSHKRTPDSDRWLW